MWMTTSGQRAIRKTGVGSPSAVVQEEKGPSPRPSPQWNGIKGNQSCIQPKLVIGSWCLTHLSDNWFLVWGISLTRCQVTGAKFFRLHSCATRRKRAARRKGLTWVVLYGLGLRCTCTYLTGHRSCLLKKKTFRSGGCCWWPRLTHFCMVIKQA